jgi:LysR family transcriptional regulator, regulator of the ytmI operon
MRIDISNTDIESALSLRELLTFVTVARVGSALQAAKALGYAQSTVTLHVQNLERSLGVRLFERNGKRLALTDAGRLVVQEGRELLERAGDLHARARGIASETHGSVAIGVTEPLGTCRLPAVIAAFRRRDPKVNVTVRTGSNVATVALLQSGEVDFAVCGRPRRRDPGIEFKKLFEERVVVLVPKKHRFAERTHVRLGDLTGEKVLVTEESCSYRMLIEATIEAGNLELALDATFGAIMSLPHAVVAGMGVALVPSMAVTPPPPGTKSIALVRPEIALAVGVLRRKGAESSAVQNVRTFVEEQLATF